MTDHQTNAEHILGEMRNRPGMPPQLPSKDLLDAARNRGGRANSEALAEAARRMTAVLGRRTARPAGLLPTGRTFPDGGHGHLPAPSPAAGDPCERVRVRVLLLFGEWADIVADAPDHGPPVQYPAADVAAQAGVDVDQLPGMLLTADVGPGDRLAAFRTA